MPKEVRDALTAARVRQEKRPGRHADGCGLYLVVSETGGRWWQWRGSVNGRRREIGVGSARLVSLAEAREIARTWRRIARAGGDPVAERDKNKCQSLTFEEAARRVWADQIEPNAKNAKHCRQWITTLCSYAFPVIGSRPVHAIKQADILRVLSPIWTEKPETARRVRQRLRTVMNWARAAGHFAGVNPVEGVEKGLARQHDTVKHHAAMPWAEVPAFLPVLGESITALALRFLILTAARTGEVIGATWSEIDLQERLWIIPAKRMKAKRDHRVPLTADAIATLEKVRGLDDSFVFPGQKRGKGLSNMAMAQLLKRLGHGDVTVHGMRSSFRDWCEERTAFSHEVKEAALAHQVRNAVERAYRRSDLFDKRRGLMDQWSRFCCPARADVIEIGGRG